MRESLLFTFTTPGNPDVVPSIYISVPTCASPPDAQFHGSWSGLVDQYIAWRVIHGTTLHFEHIITNEALMVQFSAPISARPLFLPISAPGFPLLNLFLSCYDHTTGSTFLHVSVSRTLRSATAQPSASEAARYFFPNVRVNAIQLDAPCVIAGLSDGRCVRINLVQTEAGHQSHISVFAPTPLPPSLLTKADAPLSGSSFVSRWLKPHGFDRLRPPHLPISFSSQSANVLPPYAGPKDSVLSLASLIFPRVVATLHQSGRVCLFGCDAGMYIFVSEVHLPCKLSTTTSTAFILPGPDATLLALVMADEHPKTDSLRVFELAVAETTGSPFSLSCRQLVNREGPIPPIIAAHYFAEDIIVATRTGIVTALLNEPRFSPTPQGNHRTDRLIGAPDAISDVDPDSPRPLRTLPRKGLPGRTLWTAVDDVDEPYGLGRSIDALQLENSEILLNADRFSSKAIAKALRRPDVDEVTRDYVRDALAEIDLNDQDGDFNRIRQRAEQFTKLEDLRVRDLSWDESIGFIITREKGVFVLRPLFESEKRVFKNHQDLLTCDQDTPYGPAAWMLVRHAMCQNIAAQFLDGIARTDDNSKLSFLLKLAIRYSQSDPSTSLLHLMCNQRAKACIELNLSPTFPDVVEALNIMLQPGAELLSILMSLGEAAALGEAAMQCATLLPVSTAFSNGYVWLQTYMREVQTDQDVDEGFRQLEEIAEEKRGIYELNRALSFFILAAQTFSNGATLEDTLCALRLAGFSVSEGYSDKSGKGINDNQNWHDWEIAGNIKLGTCAFWMLERALRMFESCGVQRIAALLALEAMKCAPDSENYEQMRAKAFNHFLDDNALESALDAILTKPFGDIDLCEYRLEDAEALRDFIGEFINKAAELNKLKWLSDKDIQEPLISLCGQALERRARSSKPFDIGANDGEPWHAPGFGGFLPSGSETGEYSDLFSWHILRGDEASAASCAIEWYERLNFEGQDIIDDTVKMVQDLQTGVDGSEVYLKCLLFWTDSKIKALSWVQSAMNILNGSHSVTRSRIGWGASEIPEKGDAVVDIRWVSRRLLLSYAHRMCLREEWGVFVSGKSRSESIDHLKSEWSPLLLERDSGVSWVSSRLRRRPTYDSLLLCVELCSSWWVEVGDGPLIETVADAARAAAGTETMDFGYSDLQRLLPSVVDSCAKCGMGKRNWYTLALEKTLSTCAGRASCPEWLIDASAHGVVGTSDEGRVNRSVKGDVLGTVSALLQNNRPVDAADVLVNTLSQAELAIRDEGSVCVSFTAIDATLEILLQTAAYYPDAETAYKLLSSKAEDYISAVQERQRELKELEKERSKSGLMDEPVSPVRPLKHPADEMDVTA